MCIAELLIVEKSRYLHRISACNERVQGVTIIPHDKIVVDCVRRVVGGRLAAVDTGTVIRQE